MTIEQVNCTRCRDLHDEVDEYGDFRDLCDWCRDMAKATAEDEAELADGPAEDAAIDARDDRRSEHEWGDTHNMRRMG